MGHASIEQIARRRSSHLRAVVFCVALLPAAQHVFADAAPLANLLPPTDGDVDKDGRLDPTIFRPSGGDWWTLKSSGGYQHVLWGTSGDVPVAADYDGDGVMDVAIFRPSTGVWWLLFSGSNYTTYQSVAWGLSTDVPVPGDVDGDGEADVVIYRPSNGTWWALLSTTNYAYAGYRTWTWGISTDVPIAGDFDGDGHMDLTVYRASTSEWWSLLSSSGYVGYRRWLWGGPSAVQVAGDYDGDGTTDIAVEYPSTGNWYALLSSSNFSDFMNWTWGVSGDVPIVGDFDADGKADITVWRPSNGTWYSLVSGSGYGFQYWIWGISGDIPVPNSQTPSVPASTTISIVGSSGSQSFSPNPAAATSGGVVKWHNSDALTHRIVLDDNSYDSGNVLPGSDSGGLAVGAAGKSYHCAIHPSMVGTITAVPPLSSEARRYLIDYNQNALGAGRGVVRWVNFPVRVWAESGFREQDLSDAVEIWQTATGGRVTFSIVANANQADVVFDLSGIGVPPGACGVEGPRGSNFIITSGFGHYLSAPQCAPNGDWRIGLAHGLGHILGFGGHTPSGSDLMGTPSSIWFMSAILSEVMTWLYSVPPGTPVP